MGDHAHYLLEHLDQLMATWRQAIEDGRLQEIHVQAGLTKDVDEQGWETHAPTGEMWATVRWRKTPDA